MGLWGYGDIRFVNHGDIMILLAIPAEFWYDSLMPDIQHKLHYRGVNWKKIQKRQEQKWAARSGPVRILKEADPTKVKLIKRKKPKPQKPQLCKVREHDWDGEYKDGWLELNCTKCLVKNVSYKLSKRELECIEKGWWTVNDLYIYVNKRGKVFDSHGNRKPTKNQLKSIPPYNPFEPEKVVKVIEDNSTYIQPNNKKDKGQLLLPAMPWKWTVYKGLDILTFGYTHTKESAELIADMEIGKVLNGK